jgi:pimeloyl-ACP methyl ester carboxylesterase
LAIIHIVRFTVVKITALGHSASMWLLKLALVLTGLYAAIVCTAYFLQSWLIFPASLAGDVSDLLTQSRYVELETKDGERIVLVRIPPSQTSSKPRPLLLGFGGNAWNANAVANILHQIFPENEIAALHYRGYGPSTGQPSAKALFDDARSTYDHLEEEASQGIVVTGFSLGASVAVELAAARSLQGIVLVTPFDSLRELGASHYPWLPVRLLLRHRMEAAATLLGLDVPVALITADNDTIVPKERSAPFREAATNLRADFTIDAVGHNDIYDSPKFIIALRNSVNAVTRD